MTHPKAGSQWVYAVLKYLQPRRIETPQLGEKHVLGAKLKAGAVYPTVYLPRDQFETLSIPEPARIFVVIRDLRDTLISFYFSLRYSHPILMPRHIDMRQRLETSSVRDGLLWLMEDVTARVARIQESWIEHAAVRLVRYEDLVADEEARFIEIARFCEFPKTDGNVRRAVKDSSFERLSGRPRGREDVHSHFRKGLPGDWRNHLDDELKREFKQRYGQTLIQTGYEKDLGW